MRTISRYMFAMLPFMASCSFTQTNEGAETYDYSDSATYDYSDSVKASVEEEMVKATQDNLLQEQSDSADRAKILTAMAIQDSLCLSLRGDKFEAFPDEPADMSEEQRADRYCDFYGLSYKDETLHGDMEWCAAIYYRDSLRRISTEAYFDYLSKRMSNGCCMGFYSGELNAKQRAFGVYENKVFGVYYYDHDDSVLRTLPSLYPIQFFFTSIARVDSFYVVTCSDVTDCERSFFVASMDKDFSLVDKMSFRSGECTPPFDPWEADPVAYYEGGDYVVEDWDEPRNPEISVSDKGEVIVIHPKGYIEMNNSTKKENPFKTYTYERYELKGGKFVLKDSVKREVRM